MNDDTGFLREIHDHPDDPTHRLVYSDWLEEQGDPRGEYLRLEQRLSELDEEGTDYAETKTRLEELRASIDKDWLAYLDRTPIELCEFEFQCPKQWEKLTLTEDHRVRYCDECKKNVHYCESVKQANNLGSEGKCVAVNSHLVRKPGDVRRLTYDMGMMTAGRIAPSSYYEDIDLDEPTDDPDDLKGGVQ